MSTDIVRETTIADRVGGCLESFRDLTLALKGENRGFRDQIRLEDVEDEFGRFRIWSGNIGAHKVGRSSLDYRLRDASHIRQRVISLLVDLKEILQEAAAIIRGETVPWDCLSSDSNSDTEESNKDVENERVSGITADQLEDTTELKQLHSSMVETVTLLLRLSMAIRNPAPHDQFMRSTNIDTSYYEEYDTMHVREKFPQAEEYLVTRLGRGISRRRQYLKYREAHHKKLKYGLEITDTSTQDSKTEIVPQSTVASSLPAALKDVDYLDLTEDSSSEMGFSEASTAVSDTNTMNMPVPPLPEASQDGMPFECPLCFMIISVPSTRSWKRHVYKDLHPFICTAKHCTTPDRLFEDRNRWFEHEKEIHLRFWQCGEGCHETFSSKSAFEDHQRRKHQNTFTPNQLTAFLNIHERQVDANKTVECPLCREKIPFFPRFRRHLGKHQEQLALFAVPSDLYHTKEEDDENEEVILDDEVGLDGEESVRSESNVNPLEEDEKQPLSSVQFEPVSEAAEDLVTKPSNSDGPTIHEEIITHHRHIDHGFQDATPIPPTVIERLPSPPSPSLAPLPPPPKDSRELQTNAKDNVDAADYSRQDRGGVLEKNEEDEVDKGARFRRVEHDAANRTDSSDNNPLQNNEPDNEAEKGKTPPREPMIGEGEERPKAKIKEELEKEERQKERKMAEEEEFERKVKEKFMNAGYSPEYIEEVLQKKREEREGENLAIDPHRPTFIKVNRKYMHPDTLDHYGLPWEWDQHDEEFLIIKKYIDHDLQDELFEHTRRLKERKLIATFQERPHGEQ